MFSTHFSNFYRTSSNCSVLWVRLKAQKVLLVPMVNHLECLFKSVQHFWWSGPLHMLAIILHWLHIAKALGNFMYVGLHFVAAVILEYRQGSLCPLIAKTSQSAPPNLRVSGEDSFSNKKDTFLSLLFYTAKIHKYIKSRIWKGLFYANRTQLEKHHKTDTVLTCLLRNNSNSD